VIPDVAFLTAGVEQANKLRETVRAKKFAAAPLFQFVPHLLGADAFFCPPVEAMHAVSESYRPTIICRHYVDQQTDSLVFTKFQSDHRE